MSGENGFEWVRMLCRSRGSAGMVLSRFPDQTRWQVRNKAVFVKVADVREVTAWAWDESLISSYVCRMTRDRASALIAAAESRPAWAKEG